MLLRDHDDVRHGGGLRVVEGEDAFVLRNRLPRARYELNHQGIMRPPKRAILETMFIDLDP